MACEIREVSQAGLEFIASEEGFREKPYKDAAGIPTIGYGATYYEDNTRVKMTDPAISQERAIALFMNILKHYEKAVWSSTVNSLSHQNFDALTSLCFNIGISAFKGSTLLKLVNKNPDDVKIAKEFLKWKYSAGKPILLKRRQRESELYFS